MSRFLVQNLTFKYQNQAQPVVEDFNLEVAPGEIVALVGPSGRGKSTVLRLLSGLEKPAAGKIQLDEKILFDADVNLEPQERGVGMIFQDYALFPHLNVLENVCFGIKGRKNERRTRAMECLRLVEMDQYCDRCPLKCSGGQQQRIAIARAIAANPKILLLDEPFSNLDAELRKNVRTEVRNIIKKAGISAILVTHNMEDVEACADQVVSL